MLSGLIANAKTLLAHNAGGFSGAGLSVMAVRVGAAGLALCAQILAARLIGADAFGAYALVLVWLVLLGHTATMGTNQLICRLLAQARAHDDPGAALGLLRFSACLAGGTALTITLAGVALVNLAPLALSPAMVMLATLGLCLVPLLMAQDFLEAIARGLDRPLLGIGPAMVLRHLAIIIGVGAAIMLGADADAVTVLSFTAFGLVTSVLVQYALLHRALRDEIEGARPRYRARQWIRTALPIALLDASETLFNNADILILGLFVAPETVAFYFAATRLAQVLGYVPYAMTAATAQKYARLSTLGQTGALQALIARVTRLCTLLTAMGALALWLAAPLLLSFFGEGFDQAAAIVPLLAFGLVLTAAFGPGEDVLTMLGQERACALAFGLALLVNLGLNFALIPRFGMAGAAIATAGALGLRGALLALFAHRRLGLTLPLGMPVRHRSNQGNAIA